MIGGVSRDGSEVAVRKAFDEDNGNSGCLMSMMRVERYAVVEHYAYVEIERVAPPIYHVVEAELSDDEKRVVSDIMWIIEKQSCSEKRAKNRRAMKKGGASCDFIKKLEGYDRRRRGKIEYFVMRNMRYGDLDVLFRDENVEDIYGVLGEPVFVFHREYGCIRTNLNFDSEKLALLLVRACCHRAPAISERFMREFVNAVEMPHAENRVNGRTATDRAAERERTEANRDVDKDVDEADERKKSNGEKCESGEDSSLSMLFDMRSSGSAMSGWCRDEVDDEVDDETRATIMRLIDSCRRGKAAWMSLPDGGRMLLSSAGGKVCVAIRKHHDITLIDLLNGVLSLEMLAYLWMAVQHRFNIIIIGEPASGKTSMLRALSMFIPPNRRIISVEDVRELDFNRKNCISFITTLNGHGLRAQMKALDTEILNAAMKQRPDYVVIGEINSESSARLFFHSVSSGVPTLSTMNASRPEAIAERLSDFGIPIDMLRHIDVVPVLNIVSVSKRSAERGAAHAAGRMGETEKRMRRKCVQIVEVVDVDYDGGNIEANELFLWKPSDEFAFKGESKVFVEIMNRFEMNEEELAEDFARRTDILDALRRKNVRDHDYIGRIMYEYEINPEETARKVLKL